MKYDEDTPRSGRLSGSPPSRWSGLKFPFLEYLTAKGIVSTLAVEWIEIQPYLLLPIQSTVSTLAVEWIEIPLFDSRCSDDCGVSTLAVEWIEIPMPVVPRITVSSPPSRWSGLKCNRKGWRPALCQASPPSRWSGLKFITHLQSPPRTWSPPSRWSGLKFFHPGCLPRLKERLHPRGGVD